MMEPSVVLVGFGNICRSMHVPCLRNANATIVHAVDPDKSAQDHALSSLHGISASKNLSGIPSDANCAIVSSPTSLHYAQTRFLLERGIHVLCEKPLACTGAEAASLVELARKKGLVLQVGYYRRFHASSSAARQLITNRELGRLLRCDMVGGFPMKSRDASPQFFDRTLSCGGVLMDFGVHLLDRLLSWFDEIRLIRYFDDSEGGVEANAIVELEGSIAERGSKSGERVPLEIRLSRTSKIGNFSLLSFEKCRVRIEHNIGHSLRLEGSIGQKVLGSKVSLVFDLVLEDEKAFLGYFEQQWAEFVARMNGSEESKSSLRDAVAVSSLVETSYANRRNLQSLWEKQLWREIS